MSTIIQLSIIIILVLLLSYKREEWLLLIINVKQNKYLFIKDILINTLIRSTY